MGYAAKWKTLEDLMVELRKNGFETPSNVVDDIRSAKAMIGVVETEESKGDASMKLEEILGSLETELISEAQAVFTDREVDEWLKRLDEASLPTCEVQNRSRNSLITGVPRDQKWIRIEPIPNLSAERLAAIAQENRLSVKPEKDGRLVVYGQEEGIKGFLKKMTEEAQPNAKVTS